MGDKGDIPRLFSLEFVPWLVCRCITSTSVSFVTWCGNQASVAGQPRLIRDLVVNLPNGQGHRNLNQNIPD